ncbi:MAG TPA: 23S rRNA (guanosine(2251)-2'-O)-methyltransferase RlmB [bacterium]|nr:23S rRNA (guanosine(2251)-2'-O)-methyltransferase RlmB [bacterium]
MSEKIYGRKPVLEAIRSGQRAITRVYILQGSRDAALDQVETHAKARNIPVSLETRHRMDTLAAQENHQGVIAVVDDFKYSDLQDILDNARDKKENAFVLLLDEIEDPHNLGAIIRSADAAGVHGVVIPKNRAVEVNATVLKSSAGASEHVTTVKIANLNDAIKKLKEAGVWVVGTDIEATKYHYEYDYRQPVAIIIGNEGRGLRRLVKENCDELVKIPMAGKMSSLNASVASALMLFEVTRQRNWNVSMPLTQPPTAPAAPVWDYVPPKVYSTPPPIVETHLESPERDFFRSGPDSAPEAPSEGRPQGEIAPINIKPEDTPGTNKGGGFHW